VTYDTETEAQANRIGGGAGTTAAIGGAALLAQQLLGTNAGKDLTSTGINALKKIFDLSGNSTGLPANWFDDLSGAVGTESVDDILAALGTQEASQQAMEDAMLNVFGSGDAASSWLSSSGVTSSLLNSGSALAGGFSALTNLADGEWGWKDTGSTAGAAIGTVFGGPIGGAIGSTIGGAIGGPVGDIVEGVGGFVGDVGSDILEGAFGWVDDGCFITTAVMKAQLEEFSDDCRELTLLRRVRDEYIAHLPNGPEMLAAYREFAPVYVERISKRPDAETVWKILYDEYILEAVKHAEAGHFRKAYLVYLLMLESVQQSSFGGV
jgi:hypothetical protein